jgi:uncharacterized protein YecT (DUF1311 family)
MAQVRFLVLLSWCSLLTIPAFAQHMNEQDSPCAKVVVTTDLVACLEKARVSADMELNSLYGTIRTKLNVSDAEHLTMTERLWIQYRDANCDAERSLYEGGTASSPAYLGCVEAMTRERTKELRITYAVRLK